jgi:hypothetical protein
MAIKAIVDKIDDVPEQYRDLYTEKNGKFELTGVEGMKTEADVTRLSSALEKERKDHKAVRERFAPLGDRKPEEVLAALDRNAELEELVKGDKSEEKIATLAEARLKTRTAPLERDLHKARQDLAERDTLIKEFKNREVTRSIEDAVRGAISKSQGFAPSAVDDAMLLARSHFEVNEEGRVVTRDKLNGVSAGIEAGAWLQDLQGSRPHWWGSSGGGGSRGNNGGGGGGINPWSAKTWNMTEQSRIYRENPTRAAQMATAAGSTIGGQRPAVSK